MKRQSEKLKNITSFDCVPTLIGAKRVVTKLNSSGNYPEYFFSYIQSGNDFIIQAIVKNTKLGK